MRFSEAMTQFPRPGWESGGLGAAGGPRGAAARRGGGDGGRRAAALPRGRGVCAAGGGWLSGSLGPVREKQAARGGTGGALWEVEALPPLPRAGGPGAGGVVGLQLPAAPAAPGAPPPAGRVRSPGAERSPPGRARSRRWGQPGALGGPRLWDAAPGRAP